MYAYRFPVLWNIPTSLIPGFQVFWRTSIIQAYSLSRSDRLNTVQNSMNYTQKHQEGIEVRDRHSVPRGTPGHVFVARYCPPCSSSIVFTSCPPCALPSYRLFNHRSAKLARISGCRRAVITALRSPNSEISHLLMR